jgi:hypothetical protein
MRICRWLIIMYRKNNQFAVCSTARGSNFYFCKMYTFEKEKKKEQQ